MTRIEIEKSLKASRAYSRDLQAVSAYLRVVGAETFKRLLSVQGEDRTVLLGELKVIQKLLDVLDNNEDTSLMPSS